MELSADTGLTLTAYSPEPNSTSQDALSLLASWAGPRPVQQHVVRGPAVAESVAASGQFADEVGQFPVKPV
jgi:hypothetical protein